MTNMVRLDIYLDTHILNINNIMFKDTDRDIPGYEKQKA